MLSFWAANGHSQANKPVLPSVDSAKEFAWAHRSDEQPRFEGGQTALFKFLSDNFIVPDSARHNFGGTVYIGFIVKKNGELTNIAIKRSSCKELNEEAIRVVKLMNGKWKPGIDNGVPKDMSYTIPIKITLE